MNRRRRQFMLMALVAAIVIIAGVWWRSANIPKTDEEKYKQWQHTEALLWRTFSLERKLPAMFAKPLDLDALNEKYLDERESLADALLESGYLTNVTIPVTVAPNSVVLRSNIQCQLRKAFAERPEWEFWVHSNVFVVTCRPEHAGLCIKAVAEADRLSNAGATAVGATPGPK